jgi:VCBS repeat-containing protein
MFDTAFDDEHKQQGLAMKLLADRLMPLAGFTADGKTNAQVSINITGLNDSVVIDGSTGTVEGVDDESEEG